jgi:hypothetical protein
MSVGLHDFATSDFFTESEKECTEFNYTSSAQTDSEDPPELGKRAIKRKQFSDCIEGKHTYSCL